MKFLLIAPVLILALTAVHVASEPQTDSGNGKDDKTVMAAIKRVFAQVASVKNGAELIDLIKKETSELNLSEKFKAKIDQIMASLANINDSDSLKAAVKKIMKSMMGKGKNKNGGNGDTN